MNILIVDDETIIREWFQYTIQSFQFEHLTTETATDGADALEKLEKNHYDIIFIDIQMPRINGLQLIESIHHSGKSCLPVILSSHNDFDYAREALRHGAFEYVLKSECSKEYLKKLIQKCIAELSKNSSAVSHLRTDYLHRVFHEKENEMHGESPEKLFPELLGRSFCCIAIQYPDSSDTEFFSGFSADTLSVHSSMDFCAFLGSEDSVLYYLRPLPGQTEQQDDQAFLHSLFEDFCREHPSSLICAGRRFSSISDARSAILDTHERLEQLFYSNKNYLLPSGNPMSGTNTVPDKLSAEILGYIRCFDNHNLFKSLHAFLDWIEENKPSSIAVKSICYTVLYSLYLYHCTDTKALPETAEHIKEKIFASPHFSCLSDFVLSASRACILSLSTAKQYSIHVESALTFIAENYSSISSVSAVARSIHLNADYLTRLFKKETGENLNSYLMEYKLNIASNMLRTTKIQVSDIAIKVGIDNISYFSKKFKEQFGVQPLTYRNQNS